MVCRDEMESSGVISGMCYTRFSLEDFFHVVLRQVAASYSLWSMAVLLLTLNPARQQVVPPVTR